MRSLLVMLLAAAAFGAFLFQTHRRAAVHLAAEERALVEMREYSLRPAGEGAQTREDYIFYWLSGSGLPTVALAKPLRVLGGGSRWFLALPTQTGPEYYEFDLVQYRAPTDQPDLDAIRTWLARPANERNEDRVPFGWHAVRKPGGDAAVE